MCNGFRVINVEILTSIDTPSFQNALTRFIAVRGTCKRFRSFIGGAEPDSVVEGDVDLDELRASMNIRGIECIFNPQMLHTFVESGSAKFSPLRRISMGLNSYLDLKN